MLDGLLSRGFSSKCKSLMKASRSRIEVIRKRAEAKQRFLKEDLVKLLSNGLDINAYGRTEEYMTGLNMLSCYGFIEKSCEYIAKHLSRMQKQGECPEECREAVASLMFAAARFSDLPELRELRDTFQQRYGGNLDVFVNQKFVEILSSKTPASSKRIKVLQDIASEFSISWDSTGFEQRMATPAVAKVDVQRAIDTPRPVVLNVKNKYSYDEDNALRRDNPNHTAGKQERSEHSQKPQLMSSSQGDNDTVFRGRLQSENKYSYLIEKDSKESKEERSSNSSHGNVLDSDHAGYSSHNKESKAERSSSFSHRKILDNGQAGYMRHCKESKEEKSSSSSNGKILDNCHAGYTRHSKEPNEERSSSSSHGKILDKVHAGYTRYSKESEERSSSVSHGKILDNGYAGYTRHSNGTHTPRTIENAEALVRNRSEIPTNRVEHQARTGIAISSLEYLNQDSTLKTMRKGPAEGSDPFKPSSNYAIPPPYVASNDNISIPPYSKPKEGKYRASGRGSSHANFAVDGQYRDPSSSGKSTTDRILNELEHPDNEGRYVASPNNILNSTMKHEEGSDRLKPSKYALPPPYVKSKDKIALPPYTKPEENISRGPKHAASDADVHFVNPFAFKADEVNSSGRSFYESSRPDRKELLDGQTPAKARTYGNKEELQHYHGEKISLPKPRSSRRKHHKSSSRYDDEGSSDDAGVVKRSSSSRRRDPSRKDDDDRKHHKSSSRYDVGGRSDDAGVVKRSSSSRRRDPSRKDDDERMLDKLLIHYSKQPSSSSDADILRRKIPGQPSDHLKAAVDRNREAIPHPSRSASLPNEHTTSPKSKKLTRVNTFQPDNPAKHVHPKLPDYDDLTARFAALRGR